MYKSDKDIINVEIQEEEEEIIWVIGSGAKCLKFQCITVTMKDMDQKNILSYSIQLTP
jgi:hypothetical protein